MPKRISPGDIIEISTSKGFVYAQYVYKHEHWGALIRILDGFFTSRPLTFDELVQKPHKFVVFFPLGTAINRKICSIVGHKEIPEEMRELPLFRAPGGINKDGKVLNWWLWDGKKEWRVGQLSIEQYSLPIREVINYTALIHRIETGWMPINDRSSPLTNSFC